MLCRHWLWCLALAASGALMAGCASAPRYPQESTRDTASARKREQAGERAAAKAAQAHAHYAAGVIHEMNEEPEAAAREFYQAALQDPGDVGMILEAETKVGLKMNIAQKNLAKLLQALPALRNPTISSLSQEGWVAVETIIDEHIVRELIPALKAAGAEGIIEYPLNKVVY